MPRKARNMFVLGAVTGAALVVAVGFASAQTAQPLVTPRSPITEFRGYALILNGLEDEIWRLRPDGTGTMIYTRQGGRRECNQGGGCQGTDIGTWSRTGGQLCVDWQTRRDVSGCYTIIPRQGIHVRLVGPVTFEGTIEEY